MNGSQGGGGSGVGGSEGLSGHPQRHVGALLYAEDQSVMHLHTVC